ncbi:MAG: hypothetical protein COV43_01340 [Deltaproteobacteria bacterium CG11_big_fil_rev_8_21_14_0_20_42_23]|nr:MAG: hypothetical protein COV43_01340 [Deltaproteobacteria bacterium CG11_big_fil_rev_8_21_14_0_20_42_23]PJC63310.1 MAG: hypothetical protein CO021_10165 [Deltaproteobacteria bacterium CG_4_9_14_0_2_um_filter_42_21]
MVISRFRSLPFFKPTSSQSEGNERAQDVAKKNPAQPETEQLSSFQNTPQAKANDSWWKNVKHRFGGSDANLSHLWSQLLQGEPLELIIPYFSEHARTKSFSALQFSQRPLPETSPRIFSDIAKLACGNSNALLPAIDSIDALPPAFCPEVANCLESLAASHPREALHLMERLFAKASTEDRLQILESIVNSSHFGDRTSVEQMFVGLMARSTPDERREGIYPQLQAITSRPYHPNPKIAFKQGWLKTMTHGWLQEARDLGETIG